MTPAGAYVRRTAVNLDGARSTVEYLMIEVRPHEAVSADFLGMPADKQKRIMRELSEARK